jgi:hypothetical protein
MDLPHRELSGVKDLGHGGPPLINVGHQRQEIQRQGIDPSVQGDCRSETSAE